MSRVLIGFFKLTLGLLVLPLAVAVSRSFHQEILNLKNLSNAFGWGLVAYASCHLFVVSFLTAYQLVWQGIGRLFSFSGFLSEWLPRAVPWGPVIILLIYYIASIFWDIHQARSYIVFFLGFFFSAQIIIAAQDLYESDNGLMKAHYFFSILAIFIVNLVVLAVLLPLNFFNFSFSSFLSGSWHSAKSIYHLLYHKFLLMR